MSRILEDDMVDILDKLKNADNDVVPSVIREWAKNARPANIKSGTISTPNGEDEWLLRRYPEEEEFDDNKLIIKNTM